MAENEADEPSPTAPFRHALIAPHEKFPDDLLVPRVKLARSLDEHLDVARALFEHDLRPADFYVSAAVQRSYHLTEGFILAWDSWNVIVAAPIVRLQIDTLVRLVYLLEHPNAEDQVIKVMGGAKLTHPDGKAVRDQELVKLAGTKFPWLPPVYEKGNEWVHFSGRHVLNPLRGPR